MSTATATVGHSKRAAGRLPQFINPASLILVCAVGLTLLGITILFSASWSVRSDPYFFVRRQVTWLGFALVLGFISARVNLERLRGLAWWFAAATVLGLIAVLIPGLGVEVNGSRRWFRFGSAALQMSDIAKLAMIFVLAHYLAVNQQRIATFRRGFLWPLAGVALVAGLIVMEPDFGTAMLVGAVGVTMLWLAGTRLTFLAPGVLLGGAALAIAIALDPVRRTRILAFLDPEGSRSNAGYQLWQAKLAFGAGGVDGVGLGNGRQQMFFLPEAHTDFIFAIVGEELGLAFTLAVTATYAVIFIAGIVHLRRAPNLFQYLLISGALLLMILQAIINLGVVTGLLPTKGMSLPFISYGGSNLLLMAVVVGLMINTQTAWSRPALKDRDRGLKELEA